MKPLDRLIAQLTRNIAAIPARLAGKLTSSTAPSEAEYLIANELARALALLPSGRELWMVGRAWWSDGDADGVPRRWEFMGLFLEREEAVAACSTRQDFVAPVRVGEQLPQLPITWPGSVYPLPQAPMAPGLAGKFGDPRAGSSS